MAAAFLALPAAFLLAVHLPATPLPVFELVLVKLAAAAAGAMGALVVVRYAENLEPPTESAKKTPTKRAWGKWALWVGLAMAAPPLGLGMVLLGMWPAAVLVGFLSIVPSVALLQMADPKGWRQSGRIVIGVVSIPVLAACLDWMLALLSQPFLVGLPHVQFLESEPDIVTVPVFLGLLLAALVVVTSFILNVLMTRPRRAFLKEARRVFAKPNVTTDEVHELYALGARLGLSNRARLSLEEAAMRTGPKVPRESVEAWLENWDKVSTTRKLLDERALVPKHPVPPTGAWRRAWLATRGFVTYAYVLCFALNIFHLALLAFAGDAFSTTHAGDALALGWRVLLFPLVAPFASLWRVLFVDDSLLSVTAMAAYALAGTFALCLARRRFALPMGPRGPRWHQRVWTWAALRARLAWSAAGAYARPLFRPPSVLPAVVILTGLSLWRPEDFALWAQGVLIAYAAAILPIAWSEVATKARSRRAFYKRAKDAWETGFLANEDWKALHDFRKGRGLSASEADVLEELARRRLLGAPNARGMPKADLPPAGGPLVLRSRDIFEWDSAHGILTIRAKPGGDLRDEEAFRITDVWRARMQGERGYVLVIDFSTHPSPEKDHTASSVWLWFLEYAKRPRCFIVHGIPSESQGLVWLMERCLGMPSCRFEKAEHAEAWARAPAWKHFQWRLSRRLRRARRQLTALATGAGPRGG